MISEQLFDKQRVAQKMENIFKNHFTNDSIKFNQIISKTKIKLNKYTKYCSKLIYISNG